MWNWSCHHYANWLFVFVIEVAQTSQDESRSFTHASILWKRHWCTGIVYCLKNWCKLALNPSGLMFYLFIYFGKWLVFDPITLRNKGLLWLSTSVWGFYCKVFQGKCPFKFSNCWEWSCSQYSFIIILISMRIGITLSFLNLVNGVFPFLFSWL